MFDKYESRCALSPGMENGFVAKTEPEWFQVKANVVPAQRCKKFFFWRLLSLNQQQRDPAAWTAITCIFPQNKRG